MLEKIFDIINYIFPVYIIDHNDALYIEDRRPTGRMLILGPAALALLAYALYLFASYLWAGATPGENPWLLVALIVGSAVCALLALSGTFREIYVFDKPRDTFVFTSQSLLKKDVIEGGLSQFRAVEVEAIDVDDNNFVYRVVLLQHGPFLSGSDRHILRESETLFGSRRDEARIANAISKFLGIERVGVLTDHEDLTLLKLSE